MEVSMVDYIVEGKIVVIVGSSDDEEEIIIPEFIDELPVAKIGANSFNPFKGFSDFNPFKGDKDLKGFSGPPVDCSVNNR